MPTIQKFLFFLLFSLEITAEVAELVEINIQESPYIFIFCHGFGADCTQAYLYGIDDNNPIIPDSIITFDFADSEITDYCCFCGFPNREHACIAQTKDLSTLHEIIEQVRKNYPERKIILYGVSRGASTIINYLGSKQFTPFEKIAAAILESPFSHVKNVIKNITSPLGLIPCCTTLNYAGFRCLFPNHKSEGQHPVELVMDTPNNIPVTFIASKKDRLISYKDTLKLYATMFFNEHPQASFLLLDHGAHAKILYDKDGNKYKYFIQEFYKQYQLLS